MDKKKLVELMAKAVLYDSEKRTAQKDFVPPHAYINGDGLLSGLNLEMGVSTAVALPRRTILDVIPFLNQFNARLSLINNIHGAVITGVTEEPLGTPPATTCDQPDIMAGDIKLCVQQWPFGRWAMKDTIDLKGMGILQHNEIPVDDKIGQIGRNSSGGNWNSGLIPLPASGGVNDPSWALQVTLSTEILRRLGPEVYTGDGTQVNARRKQILGLEHLVKEGYQDVINNIPCPRADSLIFDWETDGPDGDINLNPTAIYLAFLNEYFALKERAIAFGLDPAEWIISMPQGLFRQLTYIWPCEMATNRCGGDVGNVDVRGISINVNNRDEVIDMQRNSYLWIDGDRVPVLQDSYVPVDKTTLVVEGLYKADAYFLPLRAFGGRPVLFKDYFNLNSPYGLGDAMFRNQVVPDNVVRNTANGMWQIILNPAMSGCRTIEYEIYPRVILRTPQIAGRITNIVYAPPFSQTAWNPSDIDYLNGGTTTRTVPQPPNPAP